ncbi:zinc finger protein basonuclin-2-like isoform X2 [Apodemus sylvaticus]|uniref:zinc finger protein basonuclin-2-like isoform X2 n=1 Tax=Apodemus sylvaticus TaxID=10129 RepID=UPI00224208CC|nr:zinc finger protein basonuclin-2-like isoform X2 [Apodemus sylvaticus]
MPILAIVEAHFVPSPPPNCLSYKSEGRLGDQDWQAHFKVPCCGVDPSQLESEEAEVDVRERDTQRDREPKRARDLTLRDSCTDNSMQFGTRTTAAGPGFMGTWQNADTNLLFRMSQQDMLSLIAGRGQSSYQIFRFIPEKSHWSLSDKIYTELHINCSEESVLTVASVLKQGKMKQLQHISFHNGNFLMTEEVAGHFISMFPSISLLTIAEEIITRNNFSFIFNHIVT